MSDNEIEEGLKAYRENEFNTNDDLTAFDLDALIRGVVEHYAPDASEIGQQIAHDITLSWWQRQENGRRAELAAVHGFAFDPERDGSKGGAAADDIDALTDAIEDIALQDQLFQKRVAEADARIKREVVKRVVAAKEQIRTQALAALQTGSGHGGPIQRLSTTPPKSGRYLLDKSAIDQLPENGRRIKNSPALLKACTQRLHLVECTDRRLFDHVRRTLERKYPHASAIIDGLLRPLERGFMSGRSELKLRPTILVGGPGTGKTAILRDFATALDLPVTRISVAGNADSNVFGVSAGWSTALPSVMTSAVASSLQLNPVIILDELDKAQTTHNGSVQESLLPLLEPTEAVHYHERFLMSAVDASDINWLFTANDLDRITAPLLSRCDVYEMPTPAREHVRPIVRSIVAEHARSLGLHPGFVRLSAGDLEYLETSYDRHRSVRVLAELVRRLLDDQEWNLPQA